MHARSRLSCSPASLITGAMYEGRPTVISAANDAH